MRHAYDITISVTVHDPRALWEAALKRWRDENPREPVGDEDRYRDFIGVRASPNISGCLRMLADPGLSWDGTEIEDSSAEFQMDLGGDEDKDAPLEYRYDPGVAVLFSSTDSDASTPPDTLVVIVRRLFTEENENGEKEADAEVGPMYLVSDKNNNEHHAFEDELSAPPSIVHTLPEDWNGAPLA